MTVAELCKLYRVSRKSIVHELRRGRWGANRVLSGSRQIGWFVESPPTLDPVMLPCDVARIMNVSVRVIQIWCKTGKVKAFRIGNQWRIFYVDGLKLIENRQLGFRR